MTIIQITWHLSGEWVLNGPSPLSEPFMILSVPRCARAAQHHVGLLIMVSGRSKPISPSKVTLLYYYNRVRWYLYIPIPIKRLIGRLTSERLVRTVYFFVSVQLHYGVKCCVNKLWTMCLYVSNEIRFRRSNLGSNLLMIARLYLNRHA